nr:MAG TPA: hypothetical protein [Caudoviricetes sp.]
MGGGSLRGAFARCGESSGCRYTHKSNKPVGE